MKKKYLIFGSNGFLANELKNKLNDKIKNFYFISSKDIDLTNLTSSKKLLKFKSTYNIIFFSAITPDKGNDDNTFIKNILMIKNFFKFFDIKKINHFIYISSDAVYNLNDTIINENTSPQPNDLYGLMHLTREKIISSKYLLSKASINKWKSSSSVQDELETKIAGRLAFKLILSSFFSVKIVFLSLK